ncbi:MAG TPA: hypothetical protein VJH55_01835 [Candidatus Paceibacterota bacterium]
MGIFTWIVAHKYISLFIGMTVGGDVVLVTAIFLTLRGEMSVALTALVATSATLFSDMLWYGLGWMLPKNTFVSGFIERKDSILVSMRSFFEKHSFKVVFYSKFVYGTRTAVQILSGMHRFSWRAYVAANVLGTIGYIVLLFTIGLAVHETLDTFETLAYRVPIIFLVFAIIIIFVRLWLKKIIAKKFQ